MRSDCGDTRKSSLTRRCRDSLVSNVVWAPATSRIVARPVIALPRDRPAPPRVPIGPGAAAPRRSVALAVIALRRAVPNPQRATIGPDGASPCARTALAIDADAAD